jgi:5-methyltetrahydropteroyltriglutamate--homocysteine methyltransferase
VGVVNQKHASVEPVADVLVRARRAIALLGPERVWLTPDCGFATFADNPGASAAVAEAKLRAIATAAEELRRS